MSRDAGIEPIEIGKFFKNRKGDFIVVQIKSFEGVVFADARQFFTGTDGVSRPTRRGLAITLRKLPELVALLKQAIDTAKARGLLRDEAQP